MDHKLRRQLKAGGYPRLAGATAVELPAGLLEFPARRPMDGAVHAAAAEQGPVGGVYDGVHGEPELLRNCYLNSLRLAELNGCVSVAFPCISTGVYGYPKVEAARVAVEAVSSWRTPLPEEVIFCCFSQDALAIYDRILSELPTNGT